MIATGAAGLPGLAVTATGVLLFAAAVTAARWTRRSEAGATRDRASLPGIVVQGTAFAIAAAGPVRVTRDPLGPGALVEAGAAALLFGAALALFLWARRTMGRNWSIVARARTDHALVTTGPFARVRHPIYAALALLLAGVATGLGHEARLIAALPVHALGTWLRVRVEERLLARRFGPAYTAYAARVRRFVPGVF